MEERRHIAVMFTDIVGYTALMGSDEDKAFDMLKRNHTIHATLIEKHNGTLIKEVGDGTLASFPLASDAVRCAMDIQREAKSQNIPLKIGVHQAELVMVGDDILGDGVNVASRLQEVSQEGCITISGKVYSDIKNKPDISTKFIGDKKLKGVDDPVKVYEVLCEGEKVEAKESLPPKKQSKQTYYFIGGVLILIVAVVLGWYFFPKHQPTIVEEEYGKSIAVLPFKDLSAEMNNQYFCDGIMEGILNHLSKIKDLRVASRTSVEQFREVIPQVQDIAKQLNVTYLLEASVFKSEDKIRVTAQLINAINDEHLWSEQYDRELEDVFAVMSDISQEVASEVKVVIAPEVKDKIESIPTENLEAYDLYLRGREYFTRYWQIGNSADRRTAIHLFQQAIDLDSEFAAAYIPLGHLVAYQLFLEETSLEDVFEESLNDTLLYYINKALSFDPDLADAYGLLGNYYYQIYGDYDKSNEMFKKAIELNPNYIDATWRMGLNNYESGNYIESIRYYRKAAELITIESGKSYFRNRWGGTVYQSICDYSKAETAFTNISYRNPAAGYHLLDQLAFSKGEWNKMKQYIDKICAIDSGVSCCEQLSYYFMYKENYDEAIKYYDRYKELTLKSNFWGRFRYPYYPYAYILHNLGRIDEANELFDECIELGLNCLQLERRCDDNTQVRYRLAGIYAFRGEKEKAYQMLHEMEDNVFHGDLVWYMQVDPHFESLWQDEEFKQIIQRQEKKYADIRAEIDRLEQEGLL
jgi:adenylate cyclase